jgi:hypothetical protein
MEEMFEDYFSNSVDKINEYYADFKNKKRKICIIYLMATIVFIAIYILAIFYLGFLSDNYYAPLIFGIFLLLVLCVISCVLKIKKEIRNINDKIIQDILVYISKDNNSIFEPNKRISLDNIKEMELFNLKNLKYNGKNAISTNYNHNNMNFADMEIYYFQDKVKEEKVYGNDGKEYIKRTIEKEKKYVFDGCYISATLNKKIANHIYLIPNKFTDLVINGAINDYITYSGEEIELENLEFSKKYKVYSDDEIQARYILSLSLMEKINDIDKLFKGKKYIVFKEGRRFVICIEGFKIENLRKVSLPLNNTSKKLKENIKFIFKNLYNLFEIYNVLDLGKDIYVDRT